MTVNDKDTMIENILADCNAALAAKAGLMQLKEKTVIEYEVDNEDFGPVGE
jgi:hypothetical protein